MCYPPETSGHSNSNNPLADHLHLPNFFEGADHGAGYQVFETIDQDVLGGAVNEDKYEAETQFAYRIATDNIQVNLIQVALERERDFPGLR